MNISSIFRGCFKSLTIKHLLLVTFVFCFSVAFNLQAQAQIELIDCTFLDNFSNSTELTPGVRLNPSNPGPINILDDGSPGVLGSFRNITFGPLIIAGSVEIFIENNAFDFAAGSGLAPVSILYNANGAGLDADLSNTTVIKIQLRGNDQENTSANMIITDALNNTANFSIDNLPKENQGDTFPADVDFPIAEFSGVGNLNLSEIQSIELEIRPTRRGADITIPTIEFCGPLTRDVPTLSEWGLISMAGVLGIVGFMVIRRRKVIA